MSSLVITNWSYREYGTDKWFPSAKGPCTEIYVDLLHNKQICDPFVDKNELEVQWVAERDWEYKTNFSCKTYKDDSNKKKFIFRGLDTFTTIFLNGSRLYQTDNMFVEYSVKVPTNFIQQDNELRIIFHSTLKRAQELENKNGELICWNGDTCRLYVRKAQYQFGWDWGPRLISCGPYKPILFVSGSELSVDEVLIHTSLNDSLDMATIKISIESELQDGSCLEVKLHVAEDDKPIYETELKILSTNRTILINLANPELWYPRGHGKQNLYTLTIKDVINGSFVSKSFGIKMVELIEEPFTEKRKNPGTSFYFKVNNKPIYINGLNWIPAHSFPTKVTREDYTEFLTLAANCNTNLVRVWAGGYYEDDFFYEECDRMGLMVWQDFMFACGQYPANLPPFLSSVKKEIRSQLRRLSQHCSLVLYSGNNEDYQIAEVYDLEWDKADLSGNYLHTNFPARTIYESLLPKLVSELHPHIPYRPGSPWGGSSTRDSTMGDIHQWNVWHGTQERYQDWNLLGGRFVSEFGMQAFPNLNIFQRYITDNSQLYPQSSSIDFHNKALGGERRLAIYVIENVKLKTMDLEAWIYSTQLMQSECLTFALKSWRRQWKQNSRLSGGSIIWQFNDCWPATSWSIIDFTRRPKLSYFAVKRESKPLTLGIHRMEDGSTDFWGVNTTSLRMIGTLFIYVYEVSSGNLRHERVIENVVLEANSSADILLNLQLADVTYPTISISNLVVYCKLVDEDSFILARTSDWPQPLKYLQFPEREVTVTVEEDHIDLVATKPTKCIEVTVSRSEIILDDNGIDLFPCDPRKIIAKGIRRSDKIMLKYYDQ